MKTIGLDIGSTTIKAVVHEHGKTLWRDYQRHHSRQAEMVLEFLQRMESEAGVAAGNSRIFLTGSGAGLIAEKTGGKMVQEVVAVAAAVEQLHPAVSFVSEIGGEDMKTLFLTANGQGKSKQVYMQSACSGGTGTFIEKTARKLNIPLERLVQMNYDGLELHKISSKCGIFAETDANTLFKSGVPAEEIIASLFEAVVYQNLSILTKGNTPLPQVLLLGGPNLYFPGLQQAWRHHLKKIWRERKLALAPDIAPEARILIPQDATYYACLGCIAIAATEADTVGVYVGATALQTWLHQEQWQQKMHEGKPGLLRDEAELHAFMQRYAVDADEEAPTAATASKDAVLLGCDFGSTTAKAVVLSVTGKLLFSCYAASVGNPIEDAKALFRQLQQAGFEKIAALAITGYGKDLLQDIIGADVAIVETVAHASAALHYFPDVDAICDVGGCDVKIMLLRQGTVADFRLNSQCSSGNGAFLQGVAERFNVPLEHYATHAFRARATPALTMGCGVFLQSDIINQQRKGWSQDEIMAALAAVLPLNVWVYAGQLQNLAAAGRKFVLQGGTHRNLAVVKAQVDFIHEKVPDAEVVLHPHPGEAGAFGAALCAGVWLQQNHSSRFRGYPAIEEIEYLTRTSELTMCRWCSLNCRRSFIDVRLPGAAGRPWSAIPLQAGWERVICGHNCPKGLLEDANEMRAVKSRLEEIKHAHPNVAQMVRESAFLPARIQA